MEHAGDYLDTLRRRLAAIDPESTDAVVYNAGMDPHEDCGTGGLRGITADLLATREQLVFDWARRHRTPIAFALAGGYSAGAMGVERLTALHRLTIEAAANAATRTDLRLTVVTEQHSTIGRDEGATRTLVSNGSPCPAGGAGIDHALLMERPGAEPCAAVGDRTPGSRDRHHRPGRVGQCPALGDVEGR